MNVIEELEAFRADVSGCNAALLIDLSTQMVLSSATVGRLPQEDLDALAGAAREVLTGPMAEAALGHEAEDAPTALEGLIATQTETRTFVRAGQDRQEALVCVVSPDTDLEQLFERARRTLATIMADG